MDNNLILNIILLYKKTVKHPSRIKNYFVNNYNDIYEYLINKFNWTKTFKEIEWCLLFDINELPKCPCCGKPLKFAGKPNKPYNTYCSKKCMLSLKGLEIYWEKYNNTCQEKYGTLFYTLTNEFKNKRKNTYINNYNTDIPQRTDIVKLHYKETCLEKYGVSSANMVDEVKDKIKKTCLEKYGVTTYLQILSIKDKAHSEYAINKGFETYKKNHPDGKSNIEKQLFEYLITLFGNDNIETQYYTELYPFHCDFYVKTLDLYIELNGHLSHGPHPFNKDNNDDIQLLNIWNSKDHNKHPQYKKYIEVWTIRDVKKRNTAKTNKLNYLEIFSINIDEVKTIFENYVKLHKLNVNLGINE